jgi:hypothetical protein
MVAGRVADWWRTGGGITDQRQGFINSPNVLFTITMSLSLTDLDSDVLRSVVEHVFLPPKLPQEAPNADAERGTNVAPCHILIHAAAAFRQYLSPSQELVWARMQKMMGFIYRAASSPLVEAELKGALSALSAGGGLALLLTSHILNLAFRCLCDAY